MSNSLDIFTNKLWPLIFNLPQTILQFSEIDKQHRSLVIFSIILNFSERKNPDEYNTVLRKNNFLLGNNFYGFHCSVKPQIKTLNQRLYLF